MTSRATLQARGQFTIPKDVREAVQIRPGDILFCYVDGPSTIRLEVRPRLTWQEILDRYASDEPVDVETLLRESESDAADDFVRRFERRMLEDERSSEIKPLEYFWEKYAAADSSDSKDLKDDAEAAPEEAMGE